MQFLKHYKTVGLYTVHVNNLGTEPLKDLGMFSTMPKRYHNTTSVPTDEEVWYYGIAYGAGTAKRGIRYALVITGRHNRYTYEFGLTSLKDTEILKAMQPFVAKIGYKPKRMLADRDFKLIEDIVADYQQLDPDNINEPNASQVVGASPGRQNQNDLAEIRWENIMNISRNWLTTNLLPSEFWYFGIRYGIQVLNMMPFLHKNKWTTPFECHYNIIPDYKKIQPIFSTEYVKRFRDGTSHRNTAMSQSITCILVGNDNLSDGQLFYVPHTKIIIGSSDYKLDTTHPSSSMFQLQYDGGIQLNLYIPQSSDMRTPTLNIGDRVNTISTKRKATVIYIPDNLLFYTIKYDNDNNSNYDQIQEDNLTTINQTTLISSSNINVCDKYPWIKNDGKITIFIPK